MTHEVLTFVLVSRQAAGLPAVMHKSGKLSARTPTWDGVSLASLCVDAGNPTVCLVHQDKRWQSKYHALHNTMALPLGWTQLHQPCASVLAALQFALCIRTMQGCGSLGFRPKIALLLLTCFVCHAINCTGIVTAMSFMA